MPETGKWRVQTGKGKSAYKDRYVFDSQSRALLYYVSILTHSGYKKRLVGPDGKVQARLIT